MLVNESQMRKRSSNIYFSATLTRIVVWITLGIVLRKPWMQQWMLDASKISRVKFKDRLIILFTLINIRIFEKIFGIQIFQISNF